MPYASTESVCFTDPEPENEEALADRIADRIRVPKQVKTMDRRALLAMGAVLSLNPCFPCPPERRGIVLSQPSIDGAYPKLTEAFLPGGESDPDFRAISRRFPPLWLTWHLPNMSAAHLASQFECRGPVHSLNSEWTTESESLEVVAACLRSSEAEAILKVRIEPGPDRQLQAHASLATDPIYP